MANKKTKNADMETLDENGKIKEKIYTFPNGATLIYYNQTVNKITDAHIAFNCGAIYDPKGKEGLAHFLEHMLVGHGNWVRNRNQVFEEFRNSDADFNAHTGANRIATEINCPSQNLEQIAEIYADLLFNPKFTEKSLKEEIETVTEEIRKYGDASMHPLFEDILEPNIDPLGTEESIRNIKVEDLYDYTRRHFCAENLIITVVSDLPFEKVKEIIKKTVISKAPNRPKYKNKFMKYQFEFNDNKFYDFYNQYTRNCAIELISMKPETLENYKRFAELEDYIMNGFTGRLYQALRMKKQLVYQTTFASDSMSGNTFRTIDISTSKPKFAECVKQLVAIVNDLQTRGITKEEFDCFKKTLPFRKDRELNYRYVQSDTLLNRYLEQEKVFMDMDKISAENLTYEEANEYIKNAYKNMRMSLIYEGNYDEKALTFEEVEMSVGAMPKIIKSDAEYLNLTLKDMAKIMTSDAVSNDYKDEVINLFDSVYAQVEEMRYTQEELEELQKQNMVLVDDITPEMIKQMPLDSIQEILNSPNLTLKQIFEFKAKVEKVIEQSIKVDVAKMTTSKAKMTASKSNIIDAEIVQDENIK